MSVTAGPAPLRVALLAGVCVRHDAISYSLRLKLDLLRSLRDRGCDIDVDVFVSGTDLADPRIHVRSLRDLVLDEKFGGSNLLIYELGINYDLFDSLFLLRDDQRSVGVYHNLTPPELVEPGWAREAVERGLLVRQNLACLDHVACDSELNRRDLLDCGLPETQLSVLPLPPRTSLPALDAPSWSTDPIELLFVGRLVRAKGIHDLLDAMARLRREGGESFRLTLAGNPQFSEPDVIARVRAATEEWPELRVVPEADDDMLDRLYAGSSVLILPSYHEGYCLPVLEAFHAGCQVIAYDAGNLPAIVDGLGQIVDTGDVGGLVRAMRRAMSAVSESRTSADATRIPTTTGDRARGEWFDAVGRHLAQHSRERYERSLLGILAEVGVDVSSMTLARST